MLKNADMCHYRGMPDFADTMQAIASRSRIISASMQTAVIPSLELVEEISEFDFVG